MEMVISREFDPLQIDVRALPLDPGQLDDILSFCLFTGQLQPMQQLFALFLI